MEARNGGLGKKGKSISGYFVLSICALSIVRRAREVVCGGRRRRGAEKGRVVQRERGGTLCGFSAPRSFSTLPPPPPPPPPFCRPLFLSFRAFLHDSRGRWLARFPLVICTRTELFPPSKPFRRLTRGLSFLFFFLWVCVG